MHVAIIGAGLLGVSTAYFLRRRGVDVTVIERESGPALGASYGNGGYLQAGAPDPWNAPGIFKVFAQAWLNSLSGRSDASAFAVRTTALPGLLAWGSKFLRHANRETFLNHLLKNRRLARYTLTIVDEISERESLDYARSETGGLIIFRSRRAMDAYAEVARYVGEHGSRYELLDRDALIDNEPSLAGVADKLVGAVYFPDDGAGNARVFCEQLAAIASRDGVSFHYGSPARRMTIGPGSVLVETPQGETVADALVIAAGAHSKKLAAGLGMRLPIAPAKGYSISIPMHGWQTRPRHVIADMGVHAGINPMGDVLRVAGTAEFTGFRGGVTAARTEYLIDLARQVFPKLVDTVDRAAIDPWAGFRPLSADGIPMIGPTKVSNVFVNTGHGGLGWTQAAGSAKALADMMTGKTPDIDLAEFSIERFG